MQIDWTKVKKAPVPKDASGVAYYRGEGLKIHVYTDDMEVWRDGSMLTRRGDYTETPTGEIKKIAAAMINAGEQRAARPAMRVGTGRTLTLRRPRSARRAFASV